MWASPSSPSPAAATAAGNRKQLHDADRTAVAAPCVEPGAKLRVLFAMPLKTRQITLTETSAVPWDGLLLGWAAMMPFPLLAFAAWRDNGAWAEPAAQAVQIWGAALLLFFSGVRRGLSFRTGGGPQFSQLAGFVALFVSGLAVLLAPATLAPWIVGGWFAVLAIADVRAARRGEAPLYFARLRPAQMSVATLSLLLCGLVV